MREYKPAYINIVLDNHIVDVQHVFLPDYVSINNLKIPEKEGYTFDDWYTSINGGTKFNFDDIVEVDDASETNPLEIFGIYEIKTFTMTYDAGDGTGTITDSNSPYDWRSTVTVLDDTGLTPPEDKVFNHWNTASDDSGKSFNPDDTFVITENTKLYAIYKDEPEVEEEE